MDDIIAVLQIAYNRKMALTTSRFFLGNIIDDSEGEKINEKETKSHVWVVNEALIPLLLQAENQQQPGTYSLLYMVVATSCFYSSCSSVTS
jgi:hypothetical protein